MNKFQLICVRGTQVIKQKINRGMTDGRTWIKLNAQMTSGGNIDSYLPSTKLKVRQNR